MTNKIDDSYLLCEDNYSLKLISVPKLRFIIREGKKILQQAQEEMLYKNGKPSGVNIEWVDVPLEEAEYDK